MLSKLKQFKDLRSQAKEMQNQLSGETVTVETAGGKIVLTMDGNLKLTGLAIDDSLLEAGKASKIQEGIKKAHEDAMKKMQRIMAMKMKEMGGFNLPGMS